MKAFLRNSALFLCFMAWAIYGAHAEDVKGHWKIGTHIGPSLPGGRVNDLQEPGLIVQSSLEYFFHPRLSIGLEGGFGSHHLVGDLEQDVDGDGFKEFVEVESGQSFKFVQITPYIKWGKSDDFGIDSVRWYRSYMILGVGLYHVYNRSGTYLVKQGMSGSGIDLADTRIPFKSQIHNYVGANIGYGFGVQVWTHYRLGFDLRYHRIFRNPNDADYWVPSFRLSRAF